MGFMQNWILFGYTLPIWFIQSNKTSLGRQEELNVYDFGLVFFYLVFYAIEAIADEQQWAFQSSKYKWLDAQKKNLKTSYTQQQIEDFKRGFYVRGLFKYSRQ